MRGTIYFLVMLMGALAIVGCKGKDEMRIELEQINELASTGQHRRALDLLDSIDHRSLSQPNQNLYDLLVIKSRDKDFQKHLSNKVILRLVDYYREHPKEWDLAEVLYYRGRVHFDLGDLPEAIKSFQEALDYMGDNKDNLVLREVIYGQMADLHNRMRLYEVALSYLDKAIVLTKELNDTLGNLGNLELKGAIMLHLDSIHQSKKMFEETFALAQFLSDTAIIATQKMFLSASEYKLNNYEKALNLIRDVPSKIERRALGTALGYAADIYLKNNIKDTAFIYAMELANLNGNLNRKKGFSLLLSPDLIPQLPKDSILPLISTYAITLENFVNQNANESARLQSTYYNYINWERKYDDTLCQVKLYKKIIVCTGILFLIILIFCCFLLKIRHKKNNTILQLSQELALTRTIFENPKTLQTNNESSNDVIVAESTQNILRKSIINQINEGNNIKEIDKSITNSDVYRRLLDTLQSKTLIKNIDEIWSNLEILVTESAPNFKDHINILSGKKIDEDNYNLAIAIRCGLTPTQCALLFRIQPSSLTYRRKILSTLLFGNVLSLKFLDQAILLI